MPAAQALGILNRGCKMKQVDWEKQIPGLLYFQNGGVFTGSVDDFADKSAKEFRYKLQPNDGVLKAEVWYGPFCYEMSEIADQAEFAISGEGYDDMIGWVRQKYEQMIA